MRKWFLSLSLSILFLLPKAHGWTVEFEHVPQLAVRGEASIFKPADQMEVSLGVVTLAENSHQALNESNQRMRQIIDNLQLLGLDESDYQTGRFHIRPIYQKPPKGSEEDERTVISHYEVTNTIQIKTQKIDLADKILTAAVQGGANQIDQVNFNLNNPQIYRAEAIKLATQNALADAAALASAANVKLMRVLTLSLDHWHTFPVPVMFNKAGAYSVQGETASRDVLEPGKTEIHATVNAIIEIGPQ
jgi:uncharacterized protein YggE